MPETVSGLYVFGPTIYKGSRLPVVGGQCALIVRIVSGGDI